MVEIAKLRVLTQELSVLYVEDDNGIYKSMLKFLQKFFKIVNGANNGLDALELFERGKYDIVITDLSMPKLNGIEMIKQVKAIDEQQAIIITTAHGGSTFLLEAMKLHIDGYIIKPFDYDELNFELFKIAEKISKYRENEKYKLHLEEMLKQKTQLITENYEQTIYSMVELIEQRDTYTAGHSKRVAQYCKMIAQEMGYDEKECTVLYQAAILHDVGKVDTPDAVLLNPKPLNDVEYRLIQEHVSVSYTLLNGISMFHPLAEIVYQHHERYDGKGYPNRLKGDEIHYLAKVMIVADAFDAMTTNRIYKSRKNISEALEELQRFATKQFCPDVVKSALVVLKNVTIDTSINQLPKTELEEKRFAYFYNDTITQTYNQNYLEVILAQNEEKINYLNMIVFTLSDFSKYNKKYGWKQGDSILKEFANVLMLQIKDSLVFRVFGDDFVVMTTQKLLKLEIVKENLDTFLKNHHIEYKVIEVDLEKTNIVSLVDLEFIL